MRDLICPYICNNKMERQYCEQRKTVSNMFYGYYDFLMNDVKVKSKPVTLHQRTCPICDKKLVRFVYEEVEKWIAEKGR